MGETIQEHIGRLESKLKTALFDIEKRLVALESREGHEEGVSGGVPADVNERLLELEDLLMLTQVEQTKLKETRGGTEPLHIPEDITPRLASLEARVAAFGASSEPPQNEEETKAMTAKIAAGDEHIKAVETRIAELEQKFGETMKASQDMGAAAQKIAEIKKDIETYDVQVQTLKNELDHLTKERTDLLERASRIEINTERASTYLEKMKTLEERMEAGIDKVGSLRDSMEAKLKFGIERMDLAKKDVDVKVQNLDERFNLKMDRLESLRESLENKIRVVDEQTRDLGKIEDLTYLKRTLEEESVSRISMEKHVADIGKRLGELEPLAGVVEEESVSRASLEKHVADMGKRLGELEPLAGTVKDESMKRTSLEKKLQDVHTKVSEIEKMKGAMQAMKHDVGEAAKKGVAMLEGEMQSYRESMRNEIADVQSLQKAVQEEAARRQELERRWTETENRVASYHPEDVKEKLEKEYNERLARIQADIERMRASIHEEAEQVKQILHADEVRKLRDELAYQKTAIQNIEKNLELSATRFFASNLEEFSKALDRKVPELVTRDEYMRDIREMASKMRGIEAPDLTGFARRVDSLEKRINDIYQMTRNVSSRMPVVVE
ncbi:MAG: hypothetical protein HYY37_03920 [Candidatus Aenigmarchaeota archaeon]|nr:hypothetical protein [Candidatus Aenigmarchaeota archaeon]